MQLNSLPIAMKIPAALIAAVTLASVIIGYLAYDAARSSLESTAYEDLEGIAESRKTTLGIYLQSIAEDLDVLAELPFVHQALEEFDIAFLQVPGNPVNYLQKAYITDNPHPTGQKEELDYARDGSEYSVIHAKYHPWFRSFLRKRSYYDVFLFNNQGDLIYTVFKELDYATNINSGEWKDTDLGNAFRAAIKAPVGSHSFFDFDPYAPSHGAPASFISTPVFSGNDRLGVLVFQMPIERIDHIMQQSTGLGESGETYLVGADHLLRSDSRFSKESTILKTSIKSDAVEAAIAGQHGVRTTTGLSGEEVLLAYTSMTYEGTTWAVMAEMSTDEAFADAHDLRNMILLVAGLVLVVLSGLGILIARRMVQPLEAMSGAVAKLASGEQGVEIPSLKAGDEIGQIARALATIREVGTRSAQVEAALDSSTAMVALYDLQGSPLFTNKALKDHFATVEAEIRGAMANFSANAFETATAGSLVSHDAQAVRIVDNPTQAVTHRTQLGERTYEIEAAPVTNSSGQRLGTVIEWADLTDQLAAEAREQARLEEERQATAEQLRIASENMRIKVALDNSSAPVMVADNDGVIVYLNRAAQDLFSKNDAEIGKELPNFSAANLLGSNFDIYHKNPAHQRNMLSGLRGTHQMRTQLGAITLEIVAVPVVDADGTRIGSAVEWRDLSDQVTIEKEVEGLIAAAASGDFTSRLELNGKDGFMLRLSEGMNQIMETVDGGLTEMSSVVSALSEGKLSGRIEGQYGGVFARLKDDTNTMAERLSSIVANINENADAVAGASSEISSGTDDLSVRTESQAASLEQTAATMEEISVTVKTNAERAESASDLVVSTRDKASSGGDVCNQAIEAMGAIEESSSKIGEIISVIDEIAFQTNLLALNAAVEAARAGEAGKGFAVVAAEVRALAQRSAQAAKDIKDLIQDSAQQVQGGVKLVGRTGEALSDIVTAVQQVTELMTEISSATHEQANAIGEVNASVSSMDSAVQQNAAMVEENAASARDLAERAQDLTELMGFFKLGGSQTVSSRPATTRQLTAKAPAAKPMPRLTAANAARSKPSTPRPAVKAPVVEDDDEWAEF